MHDLTLRQSLPGGTVNIDCREVETDYVEGCLVRSRMFRGAHGSGALLTDPAEGSSSTCVRQCTQDGKVVLAKNALMLLP